MGRPIVRAATLLTLLAFSACGKSVTGPGSHSNANTPASIKLVTGGDQTVRIRSAVPNPIVFRVANSTGTTLANVPVQFAVSAGGGSLISTSGTTGPDGSVTLPQWTVGATTGANTVTATVSGLPAANVSVTARYPYWTVMVYMAADNSLAYFGALNLYQMTAAGLNPEVQVVVQAEFSPTVFARTGLTPAIVDRPNYDTFRYIMDGSVSTPPNNVLIGPTTDIGNANMTDPATLHAFVQWGDSVAPAEHTVLVLWNHGGDQSGLIEDDTSAPGNYMTLDQLHSALTGLPKTDVLYFEMCLMGGYEPLLAVKDEAQTVVASEDEEIVNGWDFERFLQTMYADPAATAPTMAGHLADAFDAAYSSLPYSETIAAYDMSGFPAVDAAVSQLGNALLNSSSVTVAGLASATQDVQRYGFRWVADLVDLTDSLQAHVADTTIASAATAVRQAVTSQSFLLASHYRSGTAYNQPNENRSHGLTIVMPALGTTSMPSTGTASLASYNQQFPSSTWDSFLQQYVTGLQGLAFVDLGASTMSLWEVWDSTFVHRGQVEMLLVEPDGNVYGPIAGSVSPSGLFSADAAVVNTYWEGWASNRYVESGTFYWLAWLVSDSTNYQPLLNVAYQIGSGSVTSLYGPGTYPQLSLAQSFLADPNFSWSRLQAGDYTDLKIVATWTTGSGQANIAGPTIVAPPKTASPTSPTLTLQQMHALQLAARNALRARRESLRGAWWRRAMARDLIPHIRHRGGGK